MTVRGLLLASVALAGSALTLGDGSARADAPAPVPVLVALYTSEGCSSCPPADALLARLERTQPVAGARIVPLEMHVDIWDSIGWPDPFARADFTTRVSTYARAHGKTGIYTPEAVIDGAADVVGSDEAAVTRAVADAAHRAKTSVRAAWGGRGLTVDVASAGIARAVVRVAWVQARASVAVPRGENAGRTLEHTAVVRALVTLGEAGGPSAAPTTHFEAALPADAALYAVVLVENAVTGETVGAAILPRSS